MKCLNCGKKMSPLGLSGLYCNKCFAKSKKKKVDISEYAQKGAGYGTLGGVIAAAAVGAPTVAVTGAGILALGIGAGVGTGIGKIKSMRKKKK